MDGEQQLKQRIEKNGLAIQELAIRMENLDREIADFLKELKVTPEQLTAFVENEKNFTEANWKEVVKHKKAFEDKLQREIENIRNPSKTKKALAELNIPRHWIAVR
jgi:hypothetical protein